ncbi:MAG TPA: gluconate 2-dehydrogenase subunit 3 family protein [Gemmatimonadaceae bacterium]|nr:gluconate 2-dehydrogenase subunit 3 family protein [Gemmatimonadaceae bacterium]
MTGRDSRSDDALHTPSARSESDTGEDSPADEPHAPDRQPLYGDRAPNAPDASPGRGDPEPAPEPGSMSRRHAFGVIALAPIAAGLGWSTHGVERAARFIHELPASGAADVAYIPKFYSAREWRTVRLLADYVIPRDDRSGSATDAKAPEFVDFMLVDKDTRPASQLAMRGGLAWLDTECRHRFGTSFVGATDAQRRQVLDDISWPNKAKPELSTGVAFFSRFRDAIASAFFSSAIGWQDLRYEGNVFNPNWNGCPEPALTKLGVSYEAFDASLAKRRHQS